MTETTLNSPHDAAAAAETGPEHKGRLRRHPIIVLAGIFLLTAPLVTPILRGDGVGYYAWLASPTTDFDVDFTDEYRQGDLNFRLNLFEPDGTVQAKWQVPPDGLPMNQWSAGAAIAWLPFYAAGTVVSSVLGSSGEPGFTTAQLWFVGLGSAAMAFGALMIAFKMARTLLGTTPALIGIIGAWLASSLPIYQYFLSFYPFAVGAFVGAALLLVWHRTTGWQARRWLLLGAISGFLVSVHPIAVTWSILPVAGIAGLDPGSRRERLRALIPFAIGGVLGYLPQMGLKWALYGNPLTTGYYSAWDLLTPPVLRELFSPDHGLFSWTPILLVGVVGLFVVARRDRRLGVGLLLVFAGMLYMAAAYVVDEVSSYGNRFLVVFTVGFAIGLAGAVRWAWERRNPAWRWAAAGGVSLMIVWNVLFMFQWGWGMIPKRGPVDWATAIPAQFTTAPREMGHALTLLFTDRTELLRIVQEQDLRNWETGDL